MQTEQLVEGGYVLVTPTAVPDWLDSVPRHIVSISECIADELPRPEFWSWYTSRSEVLDAKASRAPHAQVVTVCLRPDDADLVIDELGDLPPVALLKQSVTFVGDIIGFEVVGVEEGPTFHSWHCYRYAADVQRELGIKLTNLGLFANATDAASALSWIQARPSAEAPPLVPWLAVGLGVQSST